MAGTFIVNFLFSIVGFVLYFSLSYSKYYPVETFINALWTGLVFWVSAYVVRLIFGKSLESTHEQRDELSKESTALEEFIPSMEKNGDLSDVEIDQVTSYVKELLND